MRIIVCGGRDFVDAARAFAALDAAHAKHPISLVVHGGARGADTLGGQWAIARGIAVEVHMADWKTHGKAAGFKRNKVMVDLGAEGCVAFPGGPGNGGYVPAG